MRSKCFTLPPHLRWGIPNAAGCCVPQRRQRVFFIRERMDVLAVDYEDREGVPRLYMKVLEGEVQYPTWFIKEYSRLDLTVPGRSNRCLSQSDFSLPRQLMDNYLANENGNEDQTPKSNDKCFSYGDVFKPFHGSDLLQSESNARGTSPSLVIPTYAIGQFFSYFLLVSR